MEYLDRALVRDLSETRNELLKLKRKVSQTQATLDALLLKAAQAEYNLAEEFMRLAGQKQQEVILLQRRIGQIETWKHENSLDPAKILELAQHLAGQYVMLPASQKRQLADSVFSNLQLDDVTLCGNYRLPFSILAENDNHPLNYA